MDINKIVLIKSYSDQIRKFRSLNKYKNLSEERFSQEMESLFPEFVKENKPIFELLISNKDLEFLDLMFYKLKEIDNEYKLRENEKNDIKETVEDIRSFVIANELLEEKELKEQVKNYNESFSDKYPVIINRLVEKETRNLNVDQLFLDEVKFKHESQIGDVLANKYIKPKVN
jgi:hypothetical protein